MDVHGSTKLMKIMNLGTLLFDGEKVTKGFLKIEADEVQEVCLGEPPTDATAGLVLPGFVNAHTHIGDSFAYPAPGLSLEELVGSPSGYKHQRLRTVPIGQKVRGIADSLDIMASCGTSIFSDFREEGLEGVRLLDSVLTAEHPQAIRLSRPVTDEVTARDLTLLLDAADGIGMSAISDHPMDLLRRLSDASKGRGKLFSIHLSENRREDVDSVLSLRPDFVIHATMATEEDLNALGEAGVPVVVCPTSNEFFGIGLDIPRMLKAGVTVGLGTDNGMICRPDMFQEMRTAFRLSRANGKTAPMDIVRMATVLGRKILKAEGNTTAGAKNEHDFTVVRVRGDDPMSELVTTVGAGDVLAVVRGGKVRRSAGWR